MRDLRAVHHRLNLVPEAPWVRIGVQVYPRDRRRPRVCETDSASIADFIAHAREDIPALLAEIERLQGIVDYIQADTNA